LKSGCTVEKLQGSTVEKLEKLIALYAIIALRIMAFTFLARTMRPFLPLLTKSNYSF